jgi:hypothetical protein
MYKIKHPNEWTQTQERYIVSWNERIRIAVLSTGIHVLALGDLIDSDIQTALAVKAKFNKSTIVLYA